MRKQVFGRHLKRDTNERKALFKGLASSLVLHERIQTTEEKAKAIKGSVEKLVTKAMKKDPMMAARLLQPELNRDAVKKMITEIAPRFVDRPGGYTRIIKVGNRFSDNASMVLLEWVVKGLDNKQQTAKSRGKSKDIDEVASDASLAKLGKAKKVKVVKQTKTSKPTKKVVGKKPATKETGKKEKAA